jgi:hypothetical protein
LNAHPNSWPTCCRQDNGKTLRVGEERLPNNEWLTHSSVCHSDLLAVTETGSLHTPTRESDQNAAQRFPGADEDDYREVKTRDPILANEQDRATRLGCNLDRLGAQDHPAKRKVLFPSNFG